MKKEEIKFLLNNYGKVKSAVLNNYSEIEILGYRKKEILVINNTVKKFTLLINKLKETLEDKEVITIFEMRYEKKYKDKQILNKIHMGESTFYRIKNKILVKILLLCAVNRLISEKEILQIKIY